MKRRVSVVVGVVVFFFAGGAALGYAHDWCFQDSFWTDPSDPGSGWSREPHVFSSLPEWPDWEYSSISGKTGDHVWIIQPLDCDCAEGQLLLDMSGTVGDAGPPQTIRTWLLPEGWTGGYQDYAGYEFWVDDSDQSVNLWRYDSGGETPSYEAIINYDFGADVNVKHSYIYDRKPYDGPEHEWEWTLYTEANDESPVYRGTFYEDGTGYNNFDYIACQLNGDESPIDFVGLYTVPEPSSLLLFAPALVSFAALLRKKFRRAVVP